MWVHAAFAAIFTGFEKLGCSYSSGVKEIGKEEVRTRWGSRGIPCLVLDCAVKRAFQKHFNVTF